MTMATKQDMLQKSYPDCFSTRPNVLGYRKAFPYWLGLGFISCLVNMSEGAKAGKINARCRNTEALPRHVTAGTLQQTLFTRHLHATRTPSRAYRTGESPTAPHSHHSNSALSCQIHHSQVETSKTAKQPTLHHTGRPQPLPTANPAAIKFPSLAFQKTGARFLFVFAGAGAAVLQPRRPSVSANTPPRDVDHLKHLMHKM
ncbi:hypothetical protein SVAN01_03853 [Stagonosporopsis vannaccii]|nr:hypothetical protein SVAN01_03853 [Stagonosporopsis vannaccii]